MPQPPTSGHSSSISSSSSFSSSSSSLLYPPIDDSEVSSQSDVADFASNPSMPRGGPYDIAASPEHAAVKISFSAPTVSATQKIKRAFKRRRPSHDANAILSSGDEGWTSGFGSSGSTQVPTSSKPSKLSSMNLFASRKHDHPSNRTQPPPPPPVPPKPIRVAIPAQPQAPPPRGSFMVTSPSINAAIEFMRTEEHERQRQRAVVEAAAVEQQLREVTPTDAVKISEETKEGWRKSNSTMDSGHTVRPTNAQESGSRRVSAYLVSSIDKDTDMLDFLAGAPSQEAQQQDMRSPDPPVGRQSKRRSRSLNIHMPLSQTVSPTPSFNVSQSVPLSAADLRNPSYSTTINSAPLESPYGNLMNGVGSSSNAATPKPNIRNRLAAWTGGVGRSPSPLGAASTSSPSLHTHSASVQIEQRRMHMLPDANQLDNHGLHPPRVRSPSNSSLSSSAGIRHAASGALGFAKRAGEKVGRVLGNSGNGSGSGSDTSSHRHPSPVNLPGQSSAGQHPSVAPSAFLRRTPGGTSGMWSVHSQSSSRSSSERDGRETPTPYAGMGRMVRPPKNPAGGLVFKRELWECVKDTMVSDPDARDDVAKRMLPALVYRCYQHLHKWGLEEEGLFRVTGRSSHITRLRADFDGGADYDIIDCSPSDLDPHAVASVLKAYLRELPESILTRRLAPLFDNAVTTENNKASIPMPTGAISKMGQATQGHPGLTSGPRPLPMHALRKPPSLSTFVLPTSSSLRPPSTSFIETLAELISRLPKENYDLLLTVVELIRATASRNKVTKMPLSNLLLVFCPSLNMSPSLLRALCDIPAIWERTPIFARTAEQASEEVESDRASSDSDSISDMEYKEVGAIPSAAKGKGREMPIENTQPDNVVDNPAEDTEPMSDDDIILVPVTRSRPHRIRPSDTTFSQTEAFKRSATPPSRVISPPQVPIIGDPDSLPSLEVPSFTRTDFSPQQSETSLTSLASEGLSSISSQLKMSESIFDRVETPRKAADYDKDLPASPRSPDPSSQLEHLSASSSAASSVEALVVKTVGTHGASDSQLGLGRNQTPRSATAPSPLSMGSQSAPSVVFPSYGTAPSTPTSLKKHALSISLGRLAKSSEDDESGSPVTPSRRVTRRPSINMLFNMKRSGSPAPRIRTQTISSPLNLTTPVSYEKEDPPSSPRTITDALPPVLDLNLTLGNSSGSGLWDDVFGCYGSSQEPGSATQSSHPTSVAPSYQPPQLRQIAISQPSTYTPPLSLSIPSSPSRRPTTEYLLSSGGFFSPNGPPSVLPSAEAILAAASEPCNTTGAAQASEAVSPLDEEPKDADAPTRSSSPVEELNAGIVREDISSGDESPPLSSPREPYPSRPSSPIENTFSLPHITFPLRGSLDEEDDWATAVLQAAGKPSDR
ncbi:hypothetical protein M422DRAFT_246603 [Sphaerobolus stellatus SS14]|nr:hypothetical protein M422DRAFT_246603 [Sphaerobolus stellatus SS14]